MKVLVSGIDSEVIKNIALDLASLQPDWSVSVVNSGRECLKTFRNVDCPDVIIMSKKLSDMSGFELTKYVRDDSDIPIIFISNDKNIKTLVRAFDMGVDDYIVSPVNKAIFIAQIKALVRRHIWDIQASDKALKTGTNTILDTKSENQDFNNLYIDFDSYIS